MVDSGHYDSSPNRASAYGYYLKSGVEVQRNPYRIRPDMRAVLRLSDQRMAAKIVNSFDIEATLIASALAAPGVG
jgi:hypothetical protein